MRRIIEYVSMPTCIVRKVDNDKEMNWANDLHRLVPAAMIVTLSDDGAVEIQRINGQVSFGQLIFYAAAVRPIRHLVRRLVQKLFDGFAKM